MRVLASAEEESACVAEWLRARQSEGYEPHEIGVFVRSDAELERAIKGIEDAGLSPVRLSTHPGGVSGSVAVWNHAPRQGPGVPGRRRRGL